MLEVSPKVVRHNVSCKIQEWLSTNREFFSKQNEFKPQFNRLSCQKQTSHDYIPLCNFECEFAEI